MNVKCHGCTVPPQSSAVAIFSLKTTVIVSHSDSCVAQATCELALTEVIEGGTERTAELLAESIALPASSTTFDTITFVISPVTSSNRTILEKISNHSHHPIIESLIGIFLHSSQSVALNTLTVQPQDCFTR